MAFGVLKLTDRAGSKAGGFLSSFGYVILTLCFYVLLCFITYLVLRANLGSDGGAAFISFEIATGGDPFNFKDLAFSHPILWIWILVLHVASWLMVPVLAATAVDAAHRKWEERRLALDVELRAEMGRILAEHAGVPKDEAERIIQQFLEDSRQKLAK